VKPSRVSHKFAQAVAGAMHIAGFVAILIVNGDASSQEAPARDDNRKTECALRLMQFVEELDKVFDTHYSVLPVQDLFKKYFPVSGRHFDQVFEACEKSRYCAGAYNYQNAFEITFGNSQYRPEIPLYVQINFDESGNSLPPFVVIRSW